MYQITPLEFKAAAQNMPPSPQIFSKLSRMLKSRSTGVKDIMRVVNKDASLAAQVLRISNSASYSMGNPIENLDEAINRVGFGELFRIVGMASATNTYVGRVATYRVPGTLIWENSLASGLAMEFLARFARLDTQEAYTLGLLRSIGKLIINICSKSNRVPPSYSPAKGMALDDWEQETFGVNNARAAAIVLKAWKFSSMAYEAIEYHYLPDLAPDANPYSRLMNVAAGIAERVGKAIPGESSMWDLSDESIEKIRLEPDHIDQACDLVEEKIAEVSESIAA